MFAPKFWNFHPEGLKDQERVDETRPPFSAEATVVRVKESSQDRARFGKLGLLPCCF